MQFIPSLWMAECGDRPGTSGPSVSKLFLNFIISTCSSLTCPPQKIEGGGGGGGVKREL